MSEFLQKIDIIPDIPIGPIDVSVKHLAAAVGLVVLTARWLRRRFPKSD